MPGMRQCRRCAVLVLSCCVIPSRPYAKQAVLNWRYKVRPQIALPSVAAAVRNVLSEPSSCVPEGGVTLSVTNSHHSHLRPAQFALLEHERCFMQRMVTVCYSTTDRFGTCVNSSFKIPPSDFRRSFYASLIWAKWAILADALSAARIAMWVDADVLLLRNPWIALNLLDAHSTVLYDFRHQSEDPCAAHECEQLRAQCTNVNGGQLVMTNRLLAQHIYDSRPSNLTNYHRLDQDWVEAIIRNASNGFSSCALPASFASHCWNLDMRKGRDPSLPLPKRVPFVSICNRVTHHFNCVPERRKKTIMMRTMINTWLRKCSGNGTRFLSGSNGSML